MFVLILFDFKQTRVHPCIQYLPATLLQNCIFIAQSPAKLLRPKFRAKTQNGFCRHTGCYFSFILWNSCIYKVKFSWLHSCKMSLIYLSQTAGELLVFMQKSKMAAAAILDFIFVQLYCISVGRAIN